jgi:glycyl-tRNA synthetase alpha subunit
MDFNTTIDIIIKDLREAREIIDDLKQYPGVPQIQIELAKSKCKSAEEVIAMLKTLKQEHMVERVEKVEKVEEVERVEKIKQPVSKKSVEVTESVPQKKSKEKHAETNIIADRFSGMSNTFNEQLGNIKSEGDISHAMKTKHLSNLTEAIGINDKFLFVREIFNGDQSSYNEAIAKLNKVENISDAKAVIMSYTGEGEENEAVKELLDLVKRKLPADE